MLPARNRLKERREIAATVRRGRRVPTRNFVVHIRTQSGATNPLVAFAVSKNVGNAVTRNRVSRRLRHVVTRHLSEIPGGSTVVVRALPPAATADSAQFEADLVSVLPRLAKS